jgi:16S rRNA (cytosine967-C5)-methyltransferase
MTANRSGRKPATGSRGNGASANPPPSPRAQALEVCLRVLRGQSLSDALEPALRRLSDDRDRAFCSELCHGFCRQYFALRKRLDQRLDKPLKKRDLDVQVILLLGLYQLFHTRVEDHAAVNESVKLLQRRGKGWARGLVNAVLRGFLRDRESGAPLPLEPADSYPEWMQQRLREDWRERADELFAAGDRRAPMTLRVDLRRQSREQALERLREAGIGASAHPVVDTALLLDRPRPVAELPGFAQGLLSVQDAAAQLAAPLLDCAPGDRVLDACAAPGGKTLHLLQAQPNIELLALDKDAQRLRRVRENLDRAGLTADLVAADAADAGSWNDGRPFDRILLDAPCSASGILRRHPDIKLLRKSADIPALAAGQRRLLQALWPLLKPGGRLLYATCSIFREENEDQIAAFAGDRADCVEVTPNTVQWGEQRPFGRQILTGDQAMDGFYYAVLEKAPS